ncbi:hypothetical protein [Pseudomonas sp. Gutcm_11s]|uniref:hypothetical protein n=1 Tax=Pseudomonas sp. Gutcm_11s TaxID=3026088 RepID=UPI00235E54F9|nr:hypothetical protein [Pseudomonas sp. Gutcm_11s]MDD0843384.1 hypothetical protein [Pseudomonas sp. Gutcm_11s]
MTTTDGIQDNDWEEVMSLAAAVANQTGLSLDAGLERKRLMRALDRLEQKYGRLPSILSTKADYADDANISLSLLKEAYVTADEASDLKSKVIISSSIAEIYLDSFDNKSRADFWVRTLKRDLEKYSDDEYFNELYIELAQRLEE